MISGLSVAVILWYRYILKVMTFDFYETGIPAEIMMPVSKGVFRATSGREIDCETKSNLVRIQDAEYPEYFFAAIRGLLALEGGGQVQAMGFSVYNFGRLGEDGRHPDFHASRFVGRALEYWRCVEAPVDVLCGEWKPGSVNYRQYRRALAGNLRPTDRERAAAAFTTWTGRQARRNGFSTVGFVIEDCGNIITSFNQPGLRPVAGSFQV